VTDPHVDFFLVGHPRSGSGRVDGFLAQHPKIFMAEKELHYYGSDLDYNLPARTAENYAAKFRTAAPGLLRGEASTWYLFSQRGAKEIAAAHPEAKIVALLREPVSWLASLHSHFVFTGDEPCDDFVRAFGEADRLSTARIRFSTQPRGALCYPQLVQYHDQIQRYFDAFGRERVRVVLTSDLRDDTRATLLSVLDFLGVPQDYPGLEVALAGNRRSTNANRAVYSRRVTRFVRSPMNLAVLRGLRPGLVPGHQLLLRALRRVNMHAATRRPVPANIRAELQRRFRPELERTAALIEQDLSPWCRA